MTLHTGHIAPATFAVSQVRCEKDHVRSRDCAYQVAWNINPHMKPGAVAWRRACRQHRAFLRALRDAGAGFFELPFVHGAFDSVFAKDNAVLVSQEGELRALLATMRHGQRRSEQCARARWLSARGFDVIEPPRAHIEGGDVAMLPAGRGALLGFGPRSTQRAAGVLEAFLAVPVTPLELCDPYLFHLDTALTVLSDGTALVCLEAFTPEALRTLSRTEGIQQLVPVRREDALAFGLNLVEVGDTVIIGARSPRVEALLRGLGRWPVCVRLDQFHLAGGSAACLAARVHPLPPLSARLLREGRERDRTGSLSA
ncbi:MULTISPECIES: dimethylarginine dimethylaminohydrolase family protein [Corallococcus]|uniref:dimethylarginine dimethylaminohydrolase family protein n=1 Tax=Corallococcus TaxID=83461 RepID=UPI001180B302|nr:MULTISPECIES: arginine deiminase-related protein [Corallococcus]NBD09685.1 amidinotransferase [Corallococcus silvisoli]TSC24076.1 amidinotransferase [Corallococcus sp. Z5C101001]